MVTIIDPHIKREGGYHIHEVSWLWIHQSINQSVSQSSQSVRQSVSQSVSQSVHQSVSQSVSPSVSQSVSQSVSASFNVVKLCSFYLLLCIIYFGVTFNFMFLFEYRRKQPDWDITWRTKMVVNTRIGAGQVYTCKKTTCTCTVEFYTSYCER